MKKNFLLLAFSFLILFGMFSCSKEEIKQPRQESAMKLKAASFKPSNISCTRVNLSHISLIAGELNRLYKNPCNTKSIFLDPAKCKSYYTRNYIVASNLPTPASVPIAMQDIFILALDTETTAEPDEAVNREFSVYSYYDKITSDLHWGIACKVTYLRQYACNVPIVRL